MSNIIEIPKWDGDNAPAWVETKNPDGERVRPNIICQCGVGTDIGNHHIHADGRITTSYYHHFADRPKKMQGCGWHVYLKMIGWDGGEMVPGQQKVTL